MKNRLERYALPWEDGGKLLRQFEIRLLGFMLYSLLFLTPFLHERQALIERGQHYVSTAEHVNPYLAYQGMPPFWALASRYLVPLPLYALIYLLGAATMNYLRCRKGARADYTLRRLRDPWEFHRRCLSLPLFWAALCLAVFLLLTGLYYFIYLRLTPEEWLLPARQRFWG